MPSGMSKGRSPAPAEVKLWLCEVEGITRLRVQHSAGAEGGAAEGRKGKWREGGGVGEGGRRGEGRGTQIKLEWELKQLSRFVRQPAGLAKPGND